MKKSNLIKWGLLALLGLMLIFGHNWALDVICKIVAIGLILVAGAGLLDWWKTKSKDKNALANLAGYAVIAIIGIWILCNTQSFINLINKIIGLVIAVPSAVYFYRTFKGDKNTVTMGICAVGIVLGLIIFFSNAATTWAVIASGIGLLYLAITGFLADRKK